MYVLREIANYKYKNLLQTLNIYKIHAKELHLVDR